MGILKWFNKQKYSGLGEVLSDIRQELKSLQPSDSSDIVWSKSANGMSAKLRGNNATSTQNELEDSPVQNSAYNGMFAVSLVGDTITVCDGGDPDSGTAGYYYFNGNLRHANSAVGIQPSVGWLCLKDSMLGQSGSFEIVTMLSSKPTGEDTTDYHPLARIDKNGETWAIRQVLKWQIPQMWAFASCDTQE